MTAVLVIDYGIVNLKNIVRGLEYVGFSPKISSDPDLVCRAPRVVLPGVGSFPAGIKELRTRGLDEALENIATKGRPILGICLGMQMLMESSEEYGRHSGLGIIPGDVVPIPPSDNSNLVKERKIPHVGWNSLHYPQFRDSWNSSCLKNTTESEYFYFVHSYMVQATNRADVLAHCIYGGLTLVAAIRRDNITGLQFHPERSGPAGLKILKQFRYL